MMKFNRILLKLSGESLMGAQKYGIDVTRVESYARQIKEIAEMGIQIGIVIGGGNIFRGLSGTNKGFDRVKGDSMGMLATVINSLALSSALDNENCRNKVLTAIRMEPISAYDKNRLALYNGLKECGFECIKPQGAFYLFVKSPVADEKAFCEAGKKYNILMVPGSSFACPGYVRLAYCVSYDTIINSLPEFKKLAEEFGL